mgnify:CR=1 FL=1|jgi:parallel beta-helix repeat protein|tara:strand:- start:12 stop:1340 length:1329 start_codon:yes stop_codon:yes gene_type:complete
MALTKATNRMIVGASANVEDFGAVGDGSTDDTSAFQACADSLYSTGGVLYIPKGTYKLTATINVPDAVLVNGEGNDTVLSFYSSAMLHGISFYGGSWSPPITSNVRVGVSNLRIDGSNVVWSTFVPALGAVRFYIVRTAICENVNVENWQGTGFMLDSSADITIQNCYVYRSYEHSLYLSGHYGSPGDPLTDEGGHKLINNTIVESGYASGTSHIGIKMANDVRNALVQGNFIVNSTNQAIIAESTVDCSILNNTIKDSASYGIRLLSTVAGPIVISNNTLIGSTSEEIRVLGGSGHLISNNFFKPSAGQWAIVASQINDSSIIGNLFDGLFGIDINGTSANNFVSGNNFINGPQTVGIRTNASTLNNIVTGNSSTAVSNGGTRNVFRNKFESEGAAAPVAGTWAHGDIVWDTAPAAGVTVGWVCTAAGTPGTWKSFGTIAT